MNTKSLTSLAFVGVVFVLFLAGNCLVVHAQVQEEAGSLREQRRERIPVDKLVSMLEAPKRLQLMQYERIAEVLGIRQGDTVADVGAGSGYFSFILAERVGAAGKVYAVEIEDKLLDYISGKMKRLRVSNLVPLKSSVASPNLPPASCEKILLVNVYVYLEDPVLFMKNLRPALKPGGVLAIIKPDTREIKSKRKLLLALNRKPAKRTEEATAEVVAEMKLAGFKLLETHDFLESRSFLAFGSVE